MTFHMYLHLCFIHCSLFYFKLFVCDGLIFTSVDGPIKTYKLAWFFTFPHCAFQVLSAKSTSKTFSKLFTVYLPLIYHFSHYTLIQGTMVICVASNWSPCLLPVLLSSVVKFFFHTAARLILKFDWQIKAVFPCLKNVHCLLFHLE